MRVVIAITLGTATAVSLAACVMPPHYVVPSVPVPPAYKESVPVATELQPAQPRDQVSRQGWWDIFGDSQLDALESQIAGHNQTIAEVEARVREARALLRQDRSQYFPVVSGTTAVTKSAGGTDFRAATGGTFTDYSLGVGASWEPDFWGRVR